MVLPLSVETVKRFTFIVDATTLDTVIVLPVRVEYPIEPLNRLEMDAVEKKSELPDMVEKTPAFAVEKRNELTVIVEKKTVLVVEIRIELPVMVEKTPIFVVEIMIELNVMVEKTPAFA
jgi:hypothetical protein